MPKSSPTQADRVVSHLLVGAALSWLFNKIAGFIGGLLAGLAGVWVHAKLDAPVARIIAAI
jgi:hypothetical protein